MVVAIPRDVAYIRPRRALDHILAELLNRGGGALFDVYHTLKRPTILADRYLPGNELLKNWPPAPADALLWLGENLRTASDKLHARGAPISVQRSVLAVSNPAAGNGAASRLSHINARAVDRLSMDGQMFLGGSFEQMSTAANPPDRIPSIVRKIFEISEKNQGRRAALVSFGGDKTANDVLTAAWLATQTDPGLDINVAVGPGGTANCLHRISGAPDYIWDLPQFLAQAVELPFLGLELFFDDTTAPYHSYYGTTFGASGRMFAEIERMKKAGPVKLGDIVRMLPKIVFSTKPFYASVKKNGRVVFYGLVGEVFGPLITHNVGRITTLPGPRIGAQIYLPDPIPASLLPLYEVIVRTMLIDAGFQRFISPDGRIATLSADRCIQLLPGDEFELEFFDQNHDPAQECGTREGDYHEPTHRIAGRLTPSPVKLLVDPNSELAVRQGLVEPRVPFDGITDDAVSGIINGVSALTGLTRAALFSSYRAQTFK